MSKKIILLITTLLLSQSCVYSQNIFNAVKNRNIEKVKEFIDDEEAVNSCDEEKKTPLSWACFNGKTEIVKLLLPRCSDKTINLPNYCDETPLWWACFKDNTEIVRLLLPRCSDETVNLPNNDNETPLSWACYKGNIEIVKL